MRCEIVEVQPDCRMLTDDGEAMVQAACFGAGIVQAPAYMAADELARGRLVEMLAAFRQPPIPNNVIWPGNRLMPPPSAFIDELTAVMPDGDKARRSSRLLQQPGRPVD